MVKLHDSIITKAITSLFAVLLVLTVSAFTASPAFANAGSVVQPAGILNDILSCKAPWLTIAKTKAVDASIGYSFEDDGVFCTKFVYECLQESGFDFSKSKGEPNASLSDQEAALLEFGFVKRKIDGFETLPPGSVIYAYSKNGNPKHVEFYLGTYDLSKTTVYGNPLWSDNGTPLTIGARVTDRDPAAGDQLQQGDSMWLGGEVGAFDRFSRGEDYWEYAYIPPWLA